MLTLTLLLLATVAYTGADIIYDNEVIKPDEIFDLDYARTGNVSASDDLNTTAYYCIFRSNWNVENHPALFPGLARWGKPIMISHTKQYTPFLKNRAAPNGIEQIAEATISDYFKLEVDAAGEAVEAFIEGEGFFINNNKTNENFVYLPPLRVSADHSFISGIAAMSPSPDWYSGFYLFDTLKESTQTFWDSFKIRTYPWDAGTDDGTTYTAQDRDTDPPGLITRIEVGNTNEKIFLNPAGDKVIYVAEWECVLHTCPFDEPNCEKPNWPPSNECDVLRYPQCDTPCNVTTDEDCEQCSRISNNEGKVYHKNCCLAGREPKDGTCDANGDGVIDSTTSGTNQYQYMTSIVASIVLFIVSCLL